MTDDVDVHPIDRLRARISKLEELSQRVLDVNLESNPEDGLCGVCRGRDDAECPIPDLRAALSEHQTHESRLGFVRADNPTPTMMIRIPGRSQHVAALLELVPVEVTIAGVPIAQIVDSSFDEHGTLLLMRFNDVVGWSA